MQVSGGETQKESAFHEIMPNLSSTIHVFYILQYFTEALIVAMPEEGLTSRVRLMREESFVKNTRAFLHGSFRQRDLK